MGRVYKGSLRAQGKALQPGRTIVFKGDGSAEGQSVYECDKSDIVAAIPHLWSRHPDEPTLFVHQIDVEYLENNRAKATLTYFGLTAYYDSNAGREKDSVEIITECTQQPIQTHPDFESFAGTPSSPKNGALWLDATTGEPTKKDTNAEFRGWTSGEFAGTEYYLVPSAVIRRTYYTRSAGSGPKVGKIVNSIKGFKGDAGGSYLCIGWTAREIGGITQVTEEYKAGEWNKKIYK